MLADKASVTHLNLVEYLTHNPDRITYLKSAQNPVVYSLDLLAGPTMRELARALVLEERARWCWLNKCYNNIYYRGDTIPQDHLNIANLISKSVPDKWVNEH